MKSLVLAAMVATALGMGAANAATPDSSQAQSRHTQTQAQTTQAHKPNYYNWLMGGGG
jgi:hypothetical protein